MNVDESILAHECVLFIFTAIYISDIKIILVLSRQQRHCDAINAQYYVIIVLIDHNFL